MAITSYMIQLQNASYDTIAPLPFDLAIVDRDDSKLTSAQIDRLQDSGKSVVSYLSIGEAENYRDYWQSSWNSRPPSFIAEENQNWEGNYKVEYWNPQWQSIILDDVREIAAAGYNGVFLDIVDAYDYFREQGRRTAADDMITFVSRIAEAAHAINPNFMIIANNALELLADPAYLDLIDGILKEDTWYDERGKLNETWTPFDLEYMEIAVENGKLLLSVDYPLSEAEQQAYFEIASKFGAIPFAGARQLDSIPESNFDYVASLENNDTLDTPSTMADVAPTPLSQDEDVTHVAARQPTSPTQAGDDGDNILFGENARNWISAKRGNDRVEGGSDSDTIQGGKGDDTLDGGHGNDMLNGDNDADILNGSMGDDYINGNRGNDYLTGDDGNDTLAGGKDDDTLAGGDGDDWLSGDRGNDILTGNDGSDTFSFESNNGADRITDFEQGTDVIVLDIRRIDDFSDIQGNISPTATGVIIDFGRGNSITVDGVDSLNADDFLFG